MKRDKEYEDVSSRVKALESELELIARFERQIACDPTGGYEIALGARARRLRRAEIIRELRRLQGSQAQ
jgi:hypothetical protein